MAFRADESLIWAHQIGRDYEGVEILPYGQLVSRVLDYVQGTAMALAGGPLSFAAVEAACESIGTDSPLYECRMHPGIHRRVREAIEDLEKAHLAEDDIRALASEVGGDLADKLHTLATVASDRSSTLGKLGRTTNANRVQACLEAAPKQAIPPILFFCGGHAEPLMIRFLSWLGKVADVTVVAERAASDDALFPASANLERGLGVESETFGEANVLTSSLFGPRAEGAPLRVEIVSASDSLSESEWAVRKVLEVHETGVPWDQIYLYARNVDRYAALLEAAARRFDAPISVSRRVPVSSNRLVQLLENVLTFCAGRDVKNLRPVLASSYLGLDIEARKTIHTAVNEASRSRTPWDSLAEFSREQALTFPWLLETLAWREEALESSRSLREWCRMFALLADLLVEGRFDNGTPTGDRDKHAQDALQRALEQRAQVEGARRSRPWSLEALAKALPRFWRAEEYCISTAEGGVRVVSSANSIGPAHTVYVLGMLEGVFPRRRSEDPVLTDEDREVIRSVARVELSDSRQRAAEERDEFYRLCAAPTDQLWLSYPQTQDDSDNIPAFYLQEVERALGTVPKTDLPLFGPPVSEARLAPDLVLLRGLGAPPQPALGFALNSDEAQRLVMPLVSDRYSPRDLRKAQECLFQFTFDFKVGVRSRRLTNRWGQLRRLPMQAELFAAPDPQTAANAIIEALQAFLDQAALDAPEHEVTLLRMGGQRLMREWVEREFAARAIWPRTNVRSQVKFGDPDMKGELPITGAHVRLRGTMPAISESGPYKVLHLTDSTLIKRDREADALSAGDHLEVGAYMMAMHDSAHSLAIEIDSTSGGRTRFLLPRQDGVRADTNKQLLVTDLGDQREFFRVARDLMRSVLARIESGQIKPTPGQHCEYCDFGELCRSSRLFGDDVDPFELADE